MRLCFKKATWLLILICIVPRVFAATTSLPEYTPYRKEEFRPWMEKLRRAEVITLGATALTYPVVGWVSKYDDSTSSGFWLKFAWAAGAGALIALADFIIGEVQENNSRKQQKAAAYKVLDPQGPEAAAIEKLRLESQDILNENIKESKAQ